MTLHCQATDQPAQPTISIRTRTSVQELANVLGKGYAAIARYLASLGEEPGGPPFVAYHNLDMRNLDIEMGFPVAKQLPDNGDIKAREIPAGKMASCIHVGPYSDMAPAYDELTSWIEENGYEATGMAYEFYLNDPGRTPPKELRTQILLPLKAGRGPTTAP
jgi:effector-binding domain-containing protein